MANSDKYLTAMKNIGVLLLERQFYLQAVDTFHRALTILRIPDLDIAAETNRCLRHISAPDETARAPRNLTIVSLTSEGEVIDHSYGITSASWKLLKTDVGLANDEVFAIRIDDLPSQLDMHYFAGKISVLCHNFALACNCLRRTARGYDARIERKLLAASVQYGNSGLHMVMNEIQGLQQTSLSYSSCCQLTGFYCIGVIFFRLLSEIYGTESIRDEVQMERCNTGIAQLQQGICCLQSRAPFAWIDSEPIKSYLGRNTVAPAA